MGENKHIKELDAFAKKYVQEITQENVSADFTASLMQKIALETNLDVFKPKALISKKGWLVIALSILALFFIPFKNSEKGFLNVAEIDFSFFDKIQIPNLFEFIQISNTVLFSVFFFGLMVIAQVFYLKNYFNKRYH